MSVLKSLLLAAALVSCSSPASTPLAQLTQPIGLATTVSSGGPLLFVASSGGDEVKVLDLTTLRFLPSPMQLFPGSLLTGVRPTRLAGLNLVIGTPSTPSGAVLAAGTRAGLVLIDAADATHPFVERVIPVGFGATHDPSLSAPANDVVAPSAPAPVLQAYTALPRSGAPGAVGILAATRAADGTLQVSQIAACTLHVQGDDASLPPAQPARLALSPDGVSLLVADSAGDGVILLPTATLAAADGRDCPGATRISLGAPAIAVASAPSFTDVTGHPFATGDVAAAITSDGGIFVLTSGAIAAPPGTALWATSSAPGSPHMRPLRIPGAAREVAFLLPTTDRCPAPHAPPCTDVNLPSGPNGVTLAMAVASADGSVYFADADQRTLVADRAAPSVFTLPRLVGPDGSPSPLTTPTLSVDATQMQPGVTLSERITVAFHGQRPAFAHVPGTLVSSGATLTFTSSEALTGEAVPRTACSADTTCAPGYICDTGRCQLPVAQRIAVGDQFVLRAATASATLCPSLAGQEIAVTTTLDAHTLSLTPPASVPASCFPASGVAELRVPDWTVRGSTSGFLGRAAAGTPFVAPAPRGRFDYVPGIAPPATESLFTLTVSPGAPPPLGFFFFDTASGETIATASSNDSVGGLASTLLVYNAPNASNLIFATVTGSSELLQIDPNSLFASSSAVVVYH